MNSIAKELAVLQKMTVKELRTRYAEVFGEGTLGNNKSWLVRRIAWRLQAQTEGDLSERARKRAEEIANDADLRTSPPKMSSTETITVAIPSKDDRLPPPGSILTRQYKGVLTQVKILEKGFEYDGEIYRSLSSVAKAITGSHCNGYLFFNLRSNGGEE